jgi:histidinol phosphatase-like enzyme
MSRTLKIHSLDDAERLINQQNSQIAAMQSQVTNVQAAARAEAQRIADERVRQMKADTENRFNGIINDLQRQMDREINAEKQARIRAEQEHQRALQRQANDFYGKLQTEIANVQNWTQSKINDLQNKVNQQFDNQQSQINDVRNQVRNLYEKEANAEKRAANLISDVLDRLNTAKNSQHQKYLPGRLNQIIEQVQRLANSTDPAASRIANAQTALNDIWNLEDDVARAQAHFETLRLITLKQADEIIEIMRNNRSVTAKNEETGETTELEINFWTKGEFNKLESEAKMLKQKLEDKKDSIELNEDHVKEIEKRLATIKNAQNTMRDETIRQGLASEHRVEISEDIVGALLEQGFELQGDNAHNYMGGEETTDVREGVFAVLKDANGREITVIVNTNQAGCNQVIFQRNDDKPRTEEEFRRDLNDLKHKVQTSSGVNLGASTPIPAVGDTKQQELIDPAKLAREGLKQDVKRRLGLE